MTPVHRGGNKTRQNSQLNALPPPPPTAQTLANTAFNSYQLISSTHPTYPLPWKTKA